MSLRIYRIRGTLRKLDPQTVTGIDSIAITSSRRLSPGSARDGAVDELVVAADEVARVELENGFVLWTRASDLVREHGQRALGRDGDEAWEFGGLAPRRGTSRDERGWLGLGIRILDFFGVDLAGMAAKTLGAKLEEKQLKGNPSFHRCDLGDTFALSPAPTAEAIPADQGPILVFLHGTASSCQGSFGKLWDAGNPDSKMARTRMKALYGDRAFAFEHRSLTESPIQNAVDLARALPTKATLDLVSHSRGGLVGELLCLGQRKKDGDPLLPEFIGKLFAADRIIAQQIGLSALDTEAAKERDAAYEADRKRLVELLALLEEKNFTVRRFVRVACPARGTTLASGRLDRWLSVLSFLLEKSTGDGLISDGADFLFAVVKERTDPRTLPGLEAMMPGSALTRLLHHPLLSTRADLTVIAGDIEGESPWQKIKLLATDWFFGADHDLVVNTGSMTGGIARPAKGARFLRDQGPKVDHFSYFENGKSVRWLIAGLIRDDASDGGFMDIAAAKREEPRWREAVRRSRAVTTPRPLAVVLPGTMGSNLNANGDPVWLKYRALLLGGLKRLRMGEPDIVPIDLIDDFYGPLLEFLARTHQVEIFPYDWRLSVRDAAQQLADALEKLLPVTERAGQPVHLVAHSMGGLVARAMIADGGRGTAVWQRIVRLPNSRLLMLGTPNAGSYEAVRWLTGFNPTQAKLSLLDITQGTDDIINLVRQFPGLLELLPFGPKDPDFSDPARWETIKKTTSAEWEVAEAVTLRAARAVWELLRAAPPDPLHMLYVAGCQPATVVDYRFVEEDDLYRFGRKRLGFIATPEGDGTVPWASGELPGVKMWYVTDTAHDMLCAQKRALPGYLDLLMGGDTSRLLKEKPTRTRAGGEPALFLLPAEPPTDGIPSENDLRGASFGGAGPTAESDAEPGPTIIEVSLRHGNLAYARHPVLVGHYMGDMIVSAEAALDFRLDGALSRRLRLGLYPGPLGTHALFFNDAPRTKPAGAVVIGLGQVGELSPGLLEEGTRAAMLDFALQVARWGDDRFGPADRPRSAALSCLLVGTGAGGMPARDSVEAILRAAVAANKRLEQVELNHKVIIDRIEFLELFEDVALAAAEALDLVLRDGELATSAVWAARSVEEGQGGVRRVRFDEAPEWWHRLDITEDSKTRAVLRFNFSTDRARAEETLATGQLALAEAFIRQASQSPRANQEAARTLFEMLLPLRLREMAPRQTDLVLLVDERSARYPWELLEDRWSQNGRPPAVNAGLVRQLKTPDFRPRPAHAFDSSAYVVGNPDLSGWELFADLPGARQEARQVATLLGAGGYQVRDCIDEKTDAIIEGLHRAAYRILHLAGHGAYDYPLPAGAAGACESCRQPTPMPERKVSGMVIGRETFLTPGDVEQMRWVPELVFINCCHLGRIGGARDVDRGALAANLAVQFIRMGVRAVVAAGWAVDDGAATVFAETFYRRLLDGESFGEATRAAREEIWLRFPDCNTWGAYQCYGDPGYRLRGGESVRGSNTTKFHAPSELVVELDNLARRLRVENPKGDADEETRRIESEISALVARIPETRQEEWLKRGDVSAAEGLAWGEARCWPRAIQCLERAFGATKGDCPLKAVEQCANYQIRHAAAEWLALRPALAAAREKRGDTTREAKKAGSEAEKAALEAVLTRQAEVLAGLQAQHKELVSRINSAIDQLDALCKRAATEERLNLLGGACKRLALVQTNKDARIKALGDMARHYREAFDFPKDKQDAYYPLTNWATAKLCMQILDSKADTSWQASLERELTHVAETMAAAHEAEPNFWRGAALADCQLVRLLVLHVAPMADAEPRAAQRAGDARALANEIVDLYRTAIRRGASPREVSSVVEHLDFLIEVAGDASEPLRQALADIRAALA
ncbi:MAG: CHAT domain-containing protein [Candidatus Competibacter sp.]|nr:CHAT domain-containing protein [Candidatus Competibacter sp.]